LFRIILIENIVKHGEGSTHQEVCVLKSEDGMICIIKRLIWLYAEMKTGTSRYMDELI
jgi:hypothetical protein